MRERDKFLRSVTPKFLSSRSLSPTPTPTPPVPLNPAPSQPLPELVSLSRDPDLPAFVTSVGQEVAAALKDIGEVLGHFPFVKTIGGLTVQILKIVEQVSDNPETWKRLADYTLQTFRVLVDRLGRAPDGVELDIQRSCDSFARSLTDLLNRAKSKQNENMSLRLAHHELDQGLQAEFYTLLHELCKIFQLDVALSTNLMVAAMKQDVKKIPDKIEEVDAHVKDVHADVKEMAELNLLSHLRALLVEGAEWRNTLTCCEDTREKILREIEQWSFLATAPTSPIAYLCGVAGLGKTTIAHTVARSLHNCQLLGGSFFFSRDYAPRRTGFNTWATIAYHLAYRHQSFRIRLCDVLKQPIPSTSERQFDELLLGPLKASELPPSPFVIVMDALDECDDAVDILQSFCRELDCLRGHIQLFLTSRPEPQFDKIIPSKETLHLYIDLRAPSNQDDLGRYLDTRMRTICTDNEGIKLLRWPNPQLRQDLLDGASGLFIWASTVCDFLEQSHDLDEDLRLILNPPDDVKDDPEEKLEAVYRVVLEQAYSHLKRSVYRDNFRPLLAAIMCVAKPLSLGDLSSLVGIKDVDAKVIVESLHAVLHSPLNPVSRSNREEKTVQVVHPSFYRYVTDPTKKSPVPVSIRHTHLWLASRYLELIDALLGKSAASPGPACHLSLQMIENVDADELYKIHASLSTKTTIDLNSLAAILDSTFVVSMPETDSQELVDLLQRILQFFDEHNYYCRHATPSLPLHFVEVRNSPGSQTILHGILFSVVVASKHLLVLPGIELRDGEGGYGRVLFGTWVGRNVAVKRIGHYGSPYKGKLNNVWSTILSLRPEIHLLQALFREVLIWKRLSSPYILPCLGVSDLFPDLLIIVSPWMEHGSVLEYTWNMGLSSKEVDGLLEKIAEGLEYLHREGILHGDLRGLYTGAQPFGNIHELRVWWAVKEGERPKGPTQDECQGRILHSELWELITRCWSQEPESRPDMEEVVAQMGRIVG
ncbi:hypothetical protein JAAARDRAFT_46586 [Jaapia argillacea MUCL 33604]|uniref:Protein kinase domain-containing protein n=1 Tax=Jaapia argillacea MUCL 33604 TaxID=933084 RepID=A0A067PW86_9AGAM|nr:hypothetical protein JAAARDRAFT_46586 [Jaapia argillacea MUCL 33604]